MVALVGVWRQFTEVGLLALGGMVGGLLFDGLRVTRGLLGSRGTVGVLLDVLFWVIVFPLAGLWLILVNGGQLRLYVWLAAGVGLAAYYVGISPYLLPLLGRMARVARRMLLWMGHGLVAGLAQVFRGLAFWQERGWVGGGGEVEQRFLESGPSVPARTDRKGR